MTLVKTANLPKLPKLTLVRGQRSDTHQEYIDWLNAMHKSAFKGSAIPFRPRPVDGNELDAEHFVYEAVDKNGDVWVRIEPIISEQTMARFSVKVTLTEKAEAFLETLPGTSEKDKFYGRMSRRASVRHELENRFVTRKRVYWDRKFKTGYIEVGTPYYIVGGLHNPKPEITETE